MCRCADVQMPACRQAGADSSLRNPFKKNEPSGWFFRIWLNIAIMDYDNYIKAVNEPLKPIFCREPYNKGLYCIITCVPV